MKIKEIRRGDKIINAGVPTAKPWRVIKKYTGFVSARRPGYSGIVAITERQLRGFKRANEDKN